MSNANEPGATAAVAVERRPTRSREEDAMAANDLVKGLNQQLNREVSTFLRYMLQAASIKGAENETVRKMYLEEVTDEVGHAQYLAGQITMLGGKPTLDPALTPPPSEILRMLEGDAREEETDVKNYIRLAQLAEQEGHFALKLKMEEQAADEDEHRHEMRRLLG
jgi:bacterioferritin